jgi:biopolymer transport protein ExbD
MAGAVEERPKPERGGSGLKSKKHRVGIRIDMTPMVDVAFLLLIFFMVTTVFRLPLAMEVNMPDKDVKVQVAESSVTTIYVDKDNQMYYRDGTWPIAPVSWGELPLVLQGTIGLNKDAIILAKIHRKANYENMVNMMDLFGDLHIERFSLVPMTDDDAALLEREKAEQ